MFDHMYYVVYDFDDVVKVIRNDERGFRWVSEALPSLIKDHIKCGVHYNSNFGFILSMFPIDKKTINELWYDKRILLKPKEEVFDSSDIKEQGE